MLSAMQDYMEDYEKQSPDRICFLLYVHSGAKWSTDWRAEEEKQGGRLGAAASPGTESGARTQDVCM